MSDINRQDPLELLRLENKELRTLLHVSQQQHAQMRQALGTTEIQRTALVHFVTALATDAGGSLVIPFEKVQAARDFCGFRFMVDRSERPDGNIDAKITCYPLSDEERVAQKEADEKALVAANEAAKEATKLPVDKARRLILPE